MSDSLDMEDPAPVLLRHFRGHHGPITCVAYNHHSNKLASSSTDKSVNLWNTEDRIRCYKFTGHSDAVNGVAWSHNGQLMATASKDRTIKVSILPAYASFHFCRIKPLILRVASETRTKPFSGRISLFRICASMSIILNAEILKILLKV